MTAGIHGCYSLPRRGDRICKPAAHRLNKLRLGRVELPGGLSAPASDMDICFKFDRIQILLWTAPRRREQDLLVDLAKTRGL
eukprot:3735922-Pyramimonas_sp.AAC.1